MADEEPREDDEWLYGEQAGIDNIKEEFEEEDIKPDLDLLEESGQEGEETVVKVEGQEGESKEYDEEALLKGDDDEEEEEEDEEDEDSDEDSVRVVIGSIIPGASAGHNSFTAITKRSGPPPDKKGKFTVEDFETAGNINGVPAAEFNLDNIDEKPWRKPGADITDYFNYGFTEDTWRAYCDRQKRMRLDSGAPLPVPPGKQGHQNHQIQERDSRGIISVAISNDNSKYGITTGGGRGDNHRGDGHPFSKRGFGMHHRERDDGRRREEPKENTIQVMTADRREYSRKAFDMPIPPFDMSVPPPSFGHGPPEPFMGGGPPEYFNHPPPFYHDHEEHYEDQQWMDSSWNMEMGMRGPPPSSSIIALKPTTNMPPPPGDDLDKDGDKSGRK